MSAKREDPEDVIQAALRQGAKTWGELQNVCKEHGITRQTMGYRLKKLRNANKVATRIREIPGRGPQTEYLLAEEAPQKDEDRVKEGITDFYDFMRRHPDREELTRHVGNITPEKAEKIAYEISIETGWFPPTESEKSKKTFLVLESLILAAKIRLNSNKDWLAGRFYTPEHLKLAKHYASKYPELIPTLDSKQEEVALWPEGLRKYFEEESLAPYLTPK
jgi:predicted ArsR family transcriptional regulator